MKKFVYRFLFLIFTFVNINFSYADTETIAWYVDDTVYTTTTCEDGSDISLPTAPTKAGYNFVGWQEQTVFRGNYSNWAQVPSTDTYRADATGDTYPKYHDKIIVFDASDWASQKIYVKFVLAWAACKVVVDGAESEPFDCISGNKTISERVYGNQVKISFQKTSNQGNILFETAGTPVKYNGTIYPANYGTILSIAYNKTGTYTFTSPEYLIGQQEFIYEGDWATDGKSGWVPVSTPLTE